MQDIIHCAELSEWEKMAVITFLVSKCSPEVKIELATTLPLAFNKLHNKLVMKVEQIRAVSGSTK